MSASEAPQWGIFPPFIRRRLGLRTPRRYRYDSLVPVRFGAPVFLLTHPDDVQHVLVARAENYIKTPHLTGSQGRRRAGEGLLTATGDEHRRQRRLLQPLFHRRVIERFDRAIMVETERMMGRWEPGRRIDLAAEMAHLTRSVILAVLFGDTLGGETKAVLDAAIAARRRHTEYVYHGRLPFRERLPTATVRDNRRAVKAIDAAIYAAIAERRQDGGPAGDLISDLLRASYPDGTAMSDRQVRDEVLTLTSTGYETLGEALSWIWHLLGRHPDAGARLRAELDAALNGRAPTAADVGQLPYAEMVLAEALRLYPPTWLFARILLSPDVLPAGGRVPAGATLYLCQHVMHRHPRYFPDPERFDPGRFAPDRRPPRFVYFPFGDGPHKCIGEHLARLEGVLVLAQVAQRFDITPAAGAIEPRAGVTLSPRQRLWATVEPREGASLAGTAQPVQ